MNLRTEVAVKRNNLPKFEREEPPRQHWRKWGETLRRHQLEGIVAWLLEAGRPLALISAQLLYMGQPFLGAGVHHVADLLESDEAATAFALYLHSEEHLGGTRPAGGR